MKKLLQHLLGMGSGGERPPQLTPGEFFDERLSNAAVGLSVTPEFPVINAQTAKTIAFNLTCKEYDREAAQAVWRERYGSEPVPTSE